MTSYRPLAVIVAALSGALALSQNVPGDEGVVRPYKTLVTGPAVIFDTRTLFPQVSHRFIVQPRRPENPSDVADMKVGKPNGLPVGSVQPYDRVDVQGLFPGIDATGWDPPDPTLAAGPSHIVETVNSSIGFFNKTTGALETETETTTFFSGLGAGAFQFDPKVFYDHIAGRFVIVILEQDDSPTTSKLLIAVSDDSDPTGTWFKYRLEAKASPVGTEAWWDYPGFGYNKDAYVFTGNMFSFPLSGGSFQGRQVLVVPKASILSGGAATTHYFLPTVGSTIQVCETFDSSLNKIFMVSRHSLSEVRVWAIESLTTTPVITNKLLTIPSYLNPAVNAPSPSSHFLSPLDGRLLKAVYRGGKIVTSHAVSASGDTRNRVRWYELNANNYPVADMTVSQSGEILGGADDHHFNGTVSINSVFDMACVFTRSSPTIVADIMTAGRKATDAAGTMGTPTNLESSAGSTYGSSGVNRWGDYSAVCVDPSDDFSFWCVNMNGASDGNWKTSFFKFTISAPGTLSSLSLAKTTLAGGESTTGTVTLTSAAGTGGTSVALTDNTSVISEPGTVLVLEGSSTGTFTMTTSAVSSTVSRTISAILGLTTKTVTITLTPSLNTLGLSPATLVGGASTTGTVTLYGAAPAGGQAVALTDNTSVVTTPASATVAAGTTSKTFTVTTSLVSATVTRLVTATLGSVVRNATITLTPGLKTLAMSPTTVVGGSSSTGTVTLWGAAPAGGTVVTLADNSSAITVPASATVAAATTSNTFTATTTVVTATATRQITATLAGVTKTANLTLTP